MHILLCRGWRIGLAFHGPRSAAGLPELRAVHSTNGRWDVIAEIGTKSLEDFDHTLAKIRIEGITPSETSLLLATLKAR